MRGAAAAERDDVPLGYSTIDQNGFASQGLARNRRRPRERSEVSFCIKYVVFGFNALFTLFGLFLLGVGAWAWSEKEIFTNINRLTQISVDPVLVFLLVGGLMFVIGFTGCTGALRENTTCLFLFCLAIGVLLLAEATICVLGFIYKDWVTDRIKTQMHHYILNYLNDDDVRNMIDWIQGAWLLCCGIEGPNDWENNMYFNCSRSIAGARRCGVPYSCCRRQANMRIKNTFCGHKVLEQGATLVSTRIYTQGCLSAGAYWLEKNLIPVASTLVGIAIIQILAICLAQNLRGDIYAQRAKARAWARRLNRSAL